MSQPQAAPGGTRLCPYCAEEIRVQAIRCKHCQADLRGTGVVQEAHVVPATPAPSQPDASTLVAYDSRKKSAGIAYLLWFFLGGLGAHRFYLGRTGSAAAILILMLSSVALSAVFVGLLTIWIPIVWVLVDLFLIPGIVREENAELARRLGLA